MVGFLVRTQAQGINFMVSPASKKCELIIVKRQAQVALLATAKSCGEYMVSWRCGIALLVFSLLTCKILSWTQEEKLHISKQPCIICKLNTLPTRRNQRCSRCYSFLSLNTVSGMSASAWLAISNIKLSSFFTCGNKVFLSAGIPYKALQFIEWKDINRQTYLDNKHQAIIAKIALPWLNSRKMITYS